MVSKDSKEKQIRFTLEDCLYYQSKLRELLQTLIRDNRPLDYREKKEYYEILPKALLSQGATYSVYFVHGKGWFIFASIQNLAHRLSDLYTNKVYLKTTRPEDVEITIEINDLWRFLYDKILFIFPQATAEAIHLSAESIERPQQGTFSFSAKEVLE